MGELVALLVIAGFLNGCGPDRSDDASAKALAVGFRMGVGGAVRVGRWNVVRLEVTNPGDDFLGTVEVSGVSIQQGGFTGKDFVTYRVETEIPSGSTREVLVPVRVGEWTGVEIELQGASKRARFVHDFPTTGSFSGFGNFGDDFRVLAVSDKPVTMGALSSWIGRTWVNHHRHRVGRRSSGDRSPAIADPCEIVSARPQDLLGLVPAYDSFDLVVLLGTTLTSAPAGSTEALTRWVEGGGNLVAFPGVGWAAGLSDAFRDLLSVQLGDLEAPVPDSLRVGIDPQRRGDIYYRAVLPVGAGREVASGAAVTARRGTGTTTAFSISIGGEAFPTPDAAPGLYEVLQRSVQRSFDPAGGANRVVSRLEIEAAPVLYRRSGYLVPSRFAVAVALAVYLAAGFLLPAYFFNRIKRREWTFAVVLVVTGSATLGVWKFGLVSTLRPLELEETSVVRVHADGSGAEVSSFVGIMSPAFDRVSLLPSEAARGRPAVALVHPLFTSGRDGPFTVDSAATIDATVDGSLSLPPVRVYPNELRSFRCDYTVGETPFLEIQRDTDSVTIRNRASSTIGVSLVRGDRQKSLVILGSGKTWSLSAADLATGWVSWRQKSLLPDHFFIKKFVDPRWILAEELEKGRDSDAVSRVDTAGRPAGSRVSRSSPRSTEAIPTLLVGIVDEPVFPAHGNFESRNAQSVLVWELPEL